MFVYERMTEMTYYDKNTIKLCHCHLTSRIKEGYTVIDATSGRGRDTLLLSKLVGDRGKVYAFDIQEEAIESTRQLLEENGRKNVTLILDSHEKMRNYVKEAQCVVFNFGYLPGSDHKIFSHADTSVRAIGEALEVISDDGFVCICSYYGGDTGFEEKEAVMEYLRGLDQMKYTVMMLDFINRKGCPPILYVVEKNRK